MLSAFVTFRTKLRFLEAFVDSSTWTDAQGFDGSGRRASETNVAVSLPSKGNLPSMRDLTGSMKHRYSGDVGGLERLSSAMPVGSSSRRSRRNRRHCSSSTTTCTHVMAGARWRVAAICANERSSRYSRLSRRRCAAPRFSESQFNST